MCFGSMFGTNLFGQDLKMEHVWLPNTNTALGSTIYPSAFVSNIGTTLSNPSNVGFYLSKNAKLKTTDTFLGSSYLPSIYPNSGDSSVHGITIPSDLKEGTYYLFAFADYDGLVFETNEKNNSNYIQITVSSPTVDLSINSISPNSLNYSAGDVFSATVVESNSGNTLANAHYIGYYFSNDATLDTADVLLTYNYNYGVNAGSTSYDYSNFYLPSNISSGDYYIIASADYGNNLSETNESNNANSVKITIVEPISDLSVPSFYTFNSSLAAGTTFSANTVLSNSGNTFLSNVTVGYYLSTDSVFSIGDTYLSSNYVGYLYAGNSSYDYPNFLIPSGVPAGNYYVLAVADYSNLIPESDEENNVNVLSITVTTPAVDLSLYGLSTFPSDVVAGSYLNASVYEFNNGDSYAPAHSIYYFLSTDTTYDASDVYLNSDYAYSTYPGSYNYFNPTLSIPYGTANGQYFILAITDFNSEVAEMNEANNMLFTPITISSPFVDLTISPLSYEPLKVTPGAIVYPQMTEYNYGNDYASTHYAGYFLSTDSTYDLGDTYLGSDYVGGLYANSSTGLYPYLYIPTDVPTGSYYLLAVADYMNYISESNEDNNVATFKTEVVNPEVDFSTSFPYSDSLVTTGGSYIYPTVLEYNNGTTYSRDNEVGYYLSNDMTLDSSDELLHTDYVAGISEGSYVYLNPSIYIPTSKAPGTYYLLAVADYPSFVAETDENNNVSATQLIIKSSQVDLTISYFDVDKVVSAGSSVYSKVYEYNNGTDYASSHNVSYYLSTDSIYDPYDTNIGNDYVYGTYPGNYNYLSSYLYIPYYIAKGNYFVIAVTDAGNEIVESDETNNFKAIPIKVGVNGIDLKISAISATNTNPSAGTFIYVTNTETNEGNIEAGAHHIGYFLSKDSTYDSGDKYLSANYFASLAGESSADFNPALFIPATTPDGVYYIVAVADYGNTISEIEEYNNTRALRIVIGTIPVGDVELSISSLYAFDTTEWGNANSWTYVNFSEVNTGSLAASGHYVGLYLSTDTLFSADDISLTSSYVYGVDAYSTVYQSAQIFIPYYIPAGQYFIIAKSDDGNYIAETNEYNNERATPFTVKEGDITGNVSSADLNKTSIQVYPNPSNGIVNFNSLANVDEVEVLDLNNHMVANYKVATLSGNTMDLSSVSAGVYFVKTKKEGNTTSTNKLVINK
jgi:trimeric autotransporter adhesin